MEQYRYYLDTDTGLLFRDGVRDSEYVIDKELTVTGFSGTENTDWEYIGGAV